MNYKTGPFYITVGRVMHPVPFNAKIKYLVDPVNGVTVADSMTDVDTNTVYVVPAGRKYIFVGYEIVTRNAVGGNLTVYEGDTADAETTLKLTNHIPRIQATVLPHGPFEFYLPLLPSFAAGKYVVNKPTTGAILGLMFNGYEIDE